MTILSGTTLLVLTATAILAGFALSVSLYLAADKARVVVANRPEPRLPR